MGSLVSVLVSDKTADHKEFLDRTRVGPGEPLVPGIYEGAWKSLFMEQALSGDDLKLDLKSKAPRFAGTVCGRRSRQSTTAPTRSRSI